MKIGPLSENKTLLKNHCKRNDNIYIRACTCIYSENSKSIKSNTGAPGGSHLTEIYGEHVFKIFFLRTTVWDVRRMPIR